MLSRAKPQKLDDYFIDLGKRSARGVYFCRINGYSQEVFQFLLKYYEAARLSGVVIEGGIKNPDVRQLSYYGEIMGMDFRADQGFVTASLKRWLPRMDEGQRVNVAGSICATLAGLKRAGKNDNMLKNAYIKFMCWLYYKFERIVNHLGEEKLPKILYEGQMGIYELLLMSVLSAAGCDIVLLQYDGDAAYLKADPDSSRSDELKLPGMGAFPKDFCLKKLREDLQEAARRERLYGGKPQLLNCTNAWITGKVLEDLKTASVSRGSDPQLFYNCFFRICGVEDKLTYESDLYQLQQEIRHGGRKLLIVNGEIPPPTVEEIGGIKRKNSYQNLQQMLMELSANIGAEYGAELQRLMRRAFIDLMLEEGGGEANLNRASNRAVYLLCWMKRYGARLFGGWKPPEISCFFYMGGCRNEGEALFLRFLARLPVDTVIFAPNLNRKCCLEDGCLYEVSYPGSMEVSRYPEEMSGVRMATAAYQAERELDTLMYQDTGMYRNQQYEKANAVTLKTMYEEIPILWDQELKYRPGFSVVEDMVNMPVIFSKISGVKDGIEPVYWQTVRGLVTPDTTVIKHVPFITSVSPNPVKPFAVEFYRNGRLQREKIKAHKSYQYGILRESMQDYLLDKLKLLIEQRLIRGTGENGTEYTIIAVALNLDKQILRQIQRFDFTKKNPKLVYIITGEAALSLEDTIQAAFLNLVGFDILFFVPTGYQCVEKFFSREVMEEHQIGEYLYDLRVPDLDAGASGPRHSWREKIFKRGT